MRRATVTTVSVTLANQCMRRRTLEPLGVDRDEVSDLSRGPLGALLAGQDEHLPVHGNRHGGPDAQARGVAQEEVVPQAQAHNDLAGGNSEG